MKNILIKTYLLIILFFGILNITYSSCDNPEYLVDNYCLDWSCYETTQSWYLYWEDYPTILDNTSLYEINNLKDLVDDKLTFYKAIYSWDNFIIENYCEYLFEDDSDKCFDNELSIDDLLENYTDWFSIYNEWIFKKYYNWSDYFFRNFSSILQELNWFWSYNLRDINQSILSYNYTLSGSFEEASSWSLVEISSSWSTILASSWTLTETFSWSFIQEFEFRNVCEDINCINTNREFYGLNSESDIKILKWIINSSVDPYEKLKMRIQDVSYSNSSLRAWESWTSLFVDIKQPIPLSWSWCSLLGYNYKIFYRYSWDTSLTQYLTENFFVNMSWSIVWTEPTVSTSLDINNKLNISLTEPIWLNRAWRIYFYISIEDFKWDMINQEQLNLSAIEVYPWNPTLENSYIEFVPGFYDPTNDPSYNSPDFGSWVNYYPGDTFIMNAHLKDIFWNEYYDFDDWVSISYINIESPSNALLYNWTNFIDWSVSSLSDTYEDPFFQFRYKFEDFWYFDIDFVVTYQEKDEEYNYNWNYETLDLSFDDWFDKIYIQNPLDNSDIPLTCTNWDIRLVSTCLSDDFSWCDNLWNQEIILSDESDNWTWWLIYIRDNANNQKWFAYSIDHIDKTAPNINSSNFPTWNVFPDMVSPRIEVLDPTTNTCKWEDKISYQVYLNWALYSTWIFDSYDWDISLPQSLFSISWEKNIEIYLEDFFWNTSWPFSYNYNVVPWLVDELNTQVELSSLTASDTVYANNISTYDYVLTLKDLAWNAIYWKSINYIKYDWDDIIYNDMVSNIWDDSISILTDLWPSNWSWEIYFSIKSLTPWVFNEDFKLEINNWDTNYNDIWDVKLFNVWNSDDNTFLKPISLDIKASSDSWVTWNYDFEIWTKQKYKLFLNNIWSLNSYSNWFLNVDKTTIVNEVSWHTWQEFGSIENTFWNYISNYIWFIARINAQDNVLQTPDISTDSLYISYLLWWKMVKYYLNDNNFTWKVIKWVRVIWLLEWEWKYVLTWQKENISKNDLAKQRSILKKNVYKTIKNMNDWDILNWIKYVKWRNYHISWNNLWYEVLVVNNWNVIIDWDLNTNKDKLWIIVINDDYNVLNNNQEWNIYIDKDVNYINAMIYADWWIISSESSFPYLQDTINRTIDLWNQLIIEWSIFTRNTIWGAVLWSSGLYVLPGWVETMDFNKAMVYDLNYLRRWNGLCDKNLDMDCLDTWEYEDYVIIKYDPKLKQDPIRLFTY